MYCPECKSENSDSAKFCKKCGKPLKSQPISHEKMINEISKEKASGDGKTKLIIIALVVVAIVLAGVFAFVGFSNHSDDSQSSNQQSQQASVNQEPQSSEPKQAEPSSQSAPASKSSDMEILSGSFSTGSELEDKTYARIYVGSSHAGESCTVQIWYSRDGSTLNNGNMVPVTVDSSGYIDVSSADSYKYYPDHATINLYDNSGTLLDTQSVSLATQSGTQTF